MGDRFVISGNLHAIYELVFKRLHFFIFSPLIIITKSLECGTDHCGRLENVRLFSGLARSKKFFLAPKVKFSVYVEL